MTPLLPDITVNGTTIPAARIAAEAQMHPAPAGNPGLAWRAAAHALTLREALLQEAHRRGLTPDPQETAPGLLETPDEALIRQFLDIAVTPDPVPGTTLRASYDANPARFRAPPLWEAAHILFAATEGVGEARQQALAAATTAVADIRARPGRWDDIARSASACSSLDAA
jgi:peptidyl-prolyl cis-trans isomerase C